MLGTSPIVTRQYESGDGRIEWVSHVHFPQLLILSDGQWASAEAKKAFVIYVTFKVAARPIDHTEEAPIPPVGTPRVTEGFHQQQYPQLPQEREVQGLQPKQLRGERR